MGFSKSLLLLKPKQKIGLVFENNSSHNYAPMDQRSTSSLCEDCLLLCPCKGSSCNGCIVKQLILANKQCSQLELIPIHSMAISYYCIIDGLYILIASTALPFNPIPFSVLDCSRVFCPSSTTFRVT